MRLRFRREPGLVSAEYSYRPKTGCGCCGCLAAPILLLIIGILGLVERTARRILDRL